MKRAIILMLALACACASEVVREPRTLTAVSPGTERPQIEIAQDAEVSVSANPPISGYTRKLLRGSRWQLVGTVPEGKVYRRADGIFTVEGAQIHEAYLVLDGDQLVGFYLPVEKAYAPAARLSLKLH